MRLKYLFLIIITLITGLGYGATFIASVTGNWSDAATWGGGGKPGGTDDIVVNTAITVTMDANYTTTGTATLSGTGTIQMAGFNLTIGRLIAAGSATINNSGANATITEGSANLTSTFTGTITGDINITKNGTAVLSIEGGTSLTSTSTISCNGSGDIYLGKTVTDSYAGDVTFTATSSGIIYIAYTSGLTTTFSGNIVVNCTGSGGIYFGRTAAGGSSTLASGKTISVGGSGFSSGTLSLYKFTQAGATAQSLTLTGTASTIFGTSSAINGNLSVTSPNVYLHGATFNGTATFTKNGSSNNASNGGNTFNAAFSLTNSGTGQVFLANSSADTYNGTAEFTRTNTGDLLVAYVASGNAFNDNITVNSTSTGTLYFGWGDGTATLASGKTISVGGTGFTSGTLDLRRFTQTGATAQTLTATSSGAIRLATSTVFNGDLTVTAPDVYLNGVTCNGTATFTKNGGVQNNHVGGNTYSSTFTYTNSSANQSWFASDTYHGAATFTYSGTVGGNLLTGTTTFNSTLIFNNSSTGASVCAAPYSESTTFNGDVTYNFFSSSGASILAAFDQAASSATYNGNITINSTCSGTLKLGESGGTGTLANTKTITIGGTGYTAGSLKIKNFTQTGGTAQTLSLTGTAALYLQSGTTFNGNLTATAPQLYLDGSTFNGTATLEKNGATANTSTGSNTFNGTFTVTNSGSGTMTLGGTPAFTMGAAGSIVCSSSRTLNISGSIVNGGFTLTSNIAGTSTYSGINSGAGAFTKTGTGSLTLSGANTYTGTTTLTAGTLALGATGVISNSSNLVMNGGTLSTGGYSETMGTLTMSANSTLALGAGVHSINFSASDGTTWTGGALLKVTGWTGGYNSTSGTAGKLYTGNSEELSAGKVAQVFFMHPTSSMPYTASQLSDGEILPTSTLPVEFVDFTADKVDNDVELNWTTASEINSDYFNVMHSIDGQNFSVIAKVSAQGTSHHIVNYNFVDENAVDGVNYYKLIEYDFDGATQESNTIAIIIKSSKDELVELYPNPAQEKTTLYFNSNNGGLYRLKIVDLNGKEFLSAQIPAMIGENKFNLDFTDYPSATYFILLINGENNLSKLKVIKN